MFGPLNVQSGFLLLNYCFFLLLIDFWLIGIMEIQPEEAVGVFSVCSVLAPEGHHFKI